MANAPTPRGRGYVPQRSGHPSPGTGYTAQSAAEPTTSAWGDDDGWDAPTHTVSTAARRPTATRATPLQRGLPGWLAVLVLIAIAALGGLIDVLRGSAVRGAFNIALVVGSVVAILIVRRRDMFPVVVAPPLVYFFASAGILYIRSNGLHDRSRMLDAAINWLVYGFPAIAGATAAVLIIAGVRMIIRR